MPDFSRWGANGGDPSLNAIARTDSYLDALASEQPVYATDPADAELANLMAGWRDEVRRPPARGVGTQRDAEIVLHRALASRRRTRMSMAVAGSVAAAMLCLGGFGAVVYGAAPGDALYGLRVSLFGEQQVTRDDQVALAAQTEMQQVQQLIDQGDWNAAQEKLVTITSTVQTVEDPQRQQELQQQLAQLTVKVETRDPEATLPASSVPPELLVPRVPVPPPGQVPGGPALPEPPPLFGPGSPVPLPSGIPLPDISLPPLPPLPLPKPLPDAPNEEPKPAPGEPVPLPKPLPDAPNEEPKPAPDEPVPLPKPVPDEPKPDDTKPDTKPAPQSPKPAPEPEEPKPAPKPLPAPEKPAPAPEPPKQVAPEAPAPKPAPVPVPEEPVAPAAPGPKAPPGLAPPKEEPRVEITTTIPPIPAEKPKRGNGN